MLTPKELLLYCINEKAWMRIAWLIEMFAVTSTQEVESVVEPINGMVIKTFNGVMVRYDNRWEKVNLKRKDSADPIFNFTDTFELTNKEIPNGPSSFTATVGQILLNDMLIVNPLRAKIPWMGADISLSKIEKQIAGKLLDGNLPDAPSEDHFYVSELLEFHRAAFYIDNLSMIASPGPTEKTILSPPGIEALKNKLLEENKDKLHDPAVISEISRQLAEYDGKYLEGDKGDYFLSKKMKFNARKKLYQMTITEKSFDPNSVDLVTQSLSGGWQVEDHVHLMNSIRSASYNRGVSTAKGGVMVKILDRIGSDVTITIDDCKTPLTVQDTLVEQYLGCYCVVNGQVTLITQEFLNKNKGKLINLRSPSRCNAKAPNLCKVCCGTNLSAHPTAVGSAMGVMGSVILDIYMKKMHAAAITTIKWQPTFVS